MEEPRLDNELERLYEKFAYLWKNYDFHVKYFTRAYGMYNRGFIIGLENDVCKLVFEKETNSQNEPLKDYVGTKVALFVPPDYSYFAEYGWYSLTGIISWLSGVQHEAENDVDKDLENLSQYVRLHMDDLIGLFKYPDEFETKLENIRKLYKGKQITVEKIREERA